MKITILLVGLFFFGFLHAQNVLTAIEVDEAALDASAAFWSDAPKIEQSTVTVLEGESDGV